MRPLIKLAAAILVLITAAACSTLGRPKGLVVDRLIEPAAPYAPESVAVLDFRVGDTYQGEGPRMGDIVADAMAVLKYSKDIKRIQRFAASPAEAAALAKEKGAQLAVYGTVDDLLYGGLTRPSRAMVTLFAVDVESKVVVWKLSGSLSEAPTEPSDRFFYTKYGESAPMPMLLARHVAKALVEEMAVKH